MHDHQHDCNHDHEHDHLHEHKHAEQISPLRVAPKPGRNEPCPCGSGKKYKKCCGG